MKARASIPTAALAVSGVLSGTVLAAYLWFSRFGLDYTDEGFYLNWMSGPGNYAASTSQFGFVYHPLYVVLGGDIALLRAANVLLVFGLAWLAAHLALTRLVDWRPTAAWQALAGSAGMATTATTVFSLGLLTPSYNSLSLQALLITVTGVLLAVTGIAGDRSNTLGWLLVGVGGWLTFLAKPTSALMLCLVVTIVLLVAGRGRVRGLPAAGATAMVLVVVSALVIDGSVATFVQRLEHGAAMADALSAGHDIDTAMRWDDYEPRFVQVLVLLGAASTATLVTLAGVLRNAWAKLACALAACCALALVLWSTRGTAYVFLPVDDFSASVMLSVPLAAAALLLTLAGRAGLRRLSRAQWAVIGLLGVLPHTFAFGTNNNYWLVGGWAAFFWALLAIVVAAPLAARPWFRWVLAPMVVTSQVLAVLIVLPAWESPYRQPGPVWDFDARTEVRGSTLILHPEAALHIASTTAAARDAGLKKGTAVLDLTGRSPGMIYVWGARDLVQPWNLGGYAGSSQHLALGLELVACRELAGMWLLTEPAGPRRIPDEVLNKFGAGLDDFEEVASWTAPAAIDWAQSPVGWKVTRDTAQPQQLRAPTRNRAEAKTECDRKRRDLG